MQDDIEAENKTGKSKLKLTKKPTPYDPSIESQNASVRKVSFINFHIF